MHFVMLVPKSLDPGVRAARLPVPDPRPSEKIAKLFPQTDAGKDPSKRTPAADPTKGEDRRNVPARCRCRRRVL